MIGTENINGLLRLEKGEGLTTKGHEGLFWVIALFYTSVVVVITHVNVFQDLRNQILIRVNIPGGTWYLKKKKTTIKKSRNPQGILQSHFLWRESKCCSLHACVRVQPPVPNTPKTLVVVMSNFQNCSFQPSLSFWQRTFPRTLPRTGFDEYIWTFLLLTCSVLIPMRIQITSKHLRAFLF